MPYSSEWGSSGRYDHTWEGSNLFSYFLSKDWHSLGFQLPIPILKGLDFCLGQTSSLTWTFYVYTRGVMPLCPSHTAWGMRGGWGELLSHQPQARPSQCLTVPANWQCVDFVNLLPHVFVLSPFRPEKAGPPLWSLTDCLQSEMQMSLPASRMESSWSKEATANWWRRKGCTSSWLTCRYLPPGKCAAVGSSI